jgi:MscS family membrane protein
MPGAGSWLFIFILYLISLKWLGHLWEKIARYVHLTNDKLDLTHIYQINRIILYCAIPIIFLYLIVNSITNPIDNDNNNIVLAFIISITVSLSFASLVYVSITGFFRFCEKIMRLNIVIFSIFIFCVLFNNNINAFLLSTQFYPFFGIYGVSMINLILSIMMLFWGTILLYRLYSNLKGLEKSSLYYYVLLAFFQVVIIISPLVIFIGYSNLAIGFFINILQTAFLLYFPYVLYKLSINLVYLISINIHVFYQKNISSNENQSEIKSLHPYIIYWLNFLIGFLFVIGIVSCLALCWGITPASLSYIFEIIVFQPVPIGDNTTFNLYRLISAIFVLLVFYCVVIIIRSLIDRQILKHTSATIGTKYTIKMSIRYFGMALSLAIFIYALGVDSSTMTFVISGLSIGVGIALKDTLSNFISGIIVLVSRHVRVGDWVYTVGGEIQGTILHIGLHSSTSMQFDNRPIVVPNSAINSNSVVNASRMTNRRILQYISIRYEDFSSINSITHSIKEMLLNHPRIDHDTTTLVNLVDGSTDMGSMTEGCFGSYSINIQIYAYTKTVDWVDFQDLQDEIMLKINEIITEHGAAISFPTSNVELNIKRNDEYIYNDFDRQDK